MSRRGASSRRADLARAQYALPLTITGAPRAVDAHLPGHPGGPEFYALCPGCEVHPDGGTFPMAELARAEGCPAGRRLAALRRLGDIDSGEGECRGAGREGPAHPGRERRSAPLPTPSSFLFYLTAPWRLGEGLAKDLRRRVSRAWYFHRRGSVCRQRLSRIVSDPYWTS